MIRHYKRKKKIVFRLALCILTVAASAAAGIIVFNSYTAVDSGSVAQEASGRRITEGGKPDKSKTDDRKNTAGDTLTAARESVETAGGAIAEAAEALKSTVMDSLIGGDKQADAASPSPTPAVSGFGADYKPYTGAIYEIPGTMTDTGISYDGRSHRHSELINSVIFDVYKAYLYAGILPSMTLAQGWLESGCFSTEGAVKCHNAFGIKWKGTASAPKAQDLAAPYPTKPDGSTVLVKQLRANAYFAYFNSYLEGFVMYGADPEHYYGYTNAQHYHTMRSAMLTGSWQECISGNGKSDLMTWVGTGNTNYPVRITELLSEYKLYLFDDEAYMVAYLKKHGLYDGTSAITVQGHDFYPGAGNYTFCSRNHVSADLSSTAVGNGAQSTEGRIPVAHMGSY